MLEGLEVSSVKNGQSLGTCEAKITIPTSEDVTPDHAVPRRRGRLSAESHLKGRSPPPSARSRGRRHVQRKQDHPRPRGPPPEGAAKRRKSLERSVATGVGAQPGEVTSKTSCHLDIIWECGITLHPRQGRLLSSVVVVSRDARPIFHVPFSIPKSA